MVGDLELGKESTDNGDVGNQGDVPLTKKESENFLILKKQGNDLFNEKKFHEAIAKYEEALSCAENDEFSSQILHNIGFTYDKLGDTAKSLEMYNTAIEKKPRYVKVLGRRSRILYQEKRYQEALDDMIEVVVSEIKESSQQINASTSDNNSSNCENPIGLFNLDHLPKFKPETTEHLMKIVVALTVLEAEKVLERRKYTQPPKHVVESWLRSFYGDPVSRIWRGLDESPVDKLIAEGKADDLTGYMAAIRDLKMKNYENIVEYCTKEIENIDASEENITNAYFLRGTMTFVWTMSNQTVDDFLFVTKSPSASDRMKSSAYLKLGMRHNSVEAQFNSHSPKFLGSKISDEYSKAEELWFENPDIYYHGSVFLFDRGAPVEALEMLKLGSEICDPDQSILLKTFYWTLKMSMDCDESVRNEAYNEIKTLEPKFDIPECHEMFAQAIMAAWITEREAEYNSQFDKAIALNPEDPSFKIKKLIFRHWLSEHDEEKEKAVVEEIETFMNKNGCMSNIGLFHLGQTEVSRGNFEKGFDALDKGVELSGTVHEIESRIAGKLELQFHCRVNERLKEEGLGDLAQQFLRL